MDFSIGDYTLEKTIGEGTFGKVRFGRHKHTKTPVAIKILEKIRIQEPPDIERVKREIKILQMLDHPYVVQLYEVIEDEDHIYLIMQYAGRGELFEYIVDNQRIKEPQACKFMHQLISGVQYIQSLNVAHRDLKPENLLLTPDLDILIVDFGLSNQYDEGGTLKTACGSPCYAAPEMIAGKPYNGAMTDVWSCGVIMFALLCGYLPFEDDDTQQLYRKILTADFHLPRFVSSEAKDLIRSILSVDITKRLTVQQILSHNWFKQYSPSEDSSKFKQRQSPIRATMIPGSIYAKCITGYEEEDSQEILQFSDEKELSQSQFAQDELKTTQSPLKSQSEVQKTVEEEVFRLLITETSDPGVPSPIKQQVKENEIAQILNNQEHFSPKFQNSPSSQISPQNLDETIQDIQQQIKLDNSSQFINNTIFHKPPSNLRVVQTLQQPSIRKNPLNKKKVIVNGEEVPQISQSFAQTSTINTKQKKFMQIVAQKKSQVNPNRQNKPSSFHQISVSSGVSEFRMNTPLKSQPTQEIIPEVNKKIQTNELKQTQVLKQVPQQQKSTENPIVRVDSSFSTQITSRRMKKQSQPDIIQKNNKNPLSPATQVIRPINSKQQKADGKAQKLNKSSATYRQKPPQPINYQRISKNRQSKATNQITDFSFKNNFVNEGSGKKSNYLDFKQNTQGQQGSVQKDQNPDYETSKGAPDVFQKKLSKSEILSKKELTPNFHTGPFNLSCISAKQALEISETLQDYLKQQGINFQMSGSFEFNINQTLNLQIKRLHNEKMCVLIFNQENQDFIQSLIHNANL